MARVMDCAGDHPGVMLALLTTHLEAHPEAIDAISAAVRDMARWYQAQAAGLDAVVQLREMAAKPGAAE